MTSELEDVISDVMRTRIQSLSDLRRRIEELSDLHRREEQTFVTAMHAVLHQSQATREAQAEVEGGMEEALNRERQERRRAMELVEKFKSEGTMVMEGLKDALRDMQKKYKDEQRRSSDLNRELESLRRRIGNSAATGDAQPVAPAPPRGSTSDSVARSKDVQTLSELLDESDAVITELEHRNRSLELKIQSLTDQRDKLLDAEWYQTNSVEFSKEVQELLPLMSAVNQGNAAAATVPGTAEHLARLSTLLLQHLRSEQRQRLRTEEQSARIAAGNDELLRKMENKAKDLEMKLADAMSSSAPQGGGGHHLLRGDAHLGHGGQSGGSADPTHRGSTTAAATAVDKATISGGGAAVAPFAPSSQRSPPRRAALHRALWMNTSPSKYATAGAVVPMAAGSPWQTSSSPSSPPKHSGRGGYANAAASHPPSERTSSPFGAGARNAFRYGGTTGGGVDDDDDDQFSFSPIPRRGVSQPQRRDTKGLAQPPTSTAARLSTSTGSASSGLATALTAARTEAYRPATLPAEPHQPNIIGLDDDDASLSSPPQRTDSASGGGVGLSSRNPPYRLGGGGHDDHHRRDHPPPQQPSPLILLPSLEQQLEEVTKDFHLSLQQWTEAIHPAVGKSPSSLHTEEGTADSVGNGHEDAAAPPTTRSLGAAGSELAPSLASVAGAEHL